MVYVFIIAFVILLLFHIYDYKLNFYKKEPKNIKKSEF